MTILMLTDVLHVTSGDGRPEKLGSAPVGTHISHWWQQEGHPVKITPIRKVGMSKLLSKGVDDVKSGHIRYITCNLSKSIISVSQQKHCVCNML